MQFRTFPPDISSKPIAARGSAAPVFQVLHPAGQPAARFRSVGERMGMRDASAKGEQRAGIVHSHDIAGEGAGVMAGVPARVA